MSLEPVRWMAPESLKENVFSTKSDIWSFGVVLWEIITFARIKPYSDVDSHVLRQQMMSGEHTILKKPKDCPSDVFRIMKWCWSTNPDDRPSFHLLSDILDDMREEYLEASETAFGTLTDINRLSVLYNEDELNTIASARRISTDL
ncbi:insulin-like growth factor 1 receptor [Anneissia japonica]|uniref:insulin-like growth factor 1 receptor n=1 Tax=Anneissia japonica TaxID=1529436 RepID=UPI001425AFFA|nr:insulin-like growth factor 1 receptor [Anneissia japonica]